MRCRCAPAGAVALLAAMAAMAGCLAPAAPPAPPPAPATPAPPPLAFEPAVLVDAERHGAEPVIAVAPDGAVYVEGVGLEERVFRNYLWRSTDDGRTFERVELPLPGSEHALDGYLAVTPSGRVLLSNSAGGTADLLLSDDGGATWTPSPIAQPFSHRTWFWPRGDVVHAGIDTLGGPGFYWRSMDAGATWALAGKPHDVNSFGGPLVANAQGVVTWPRYAEPANPVWDVLNPGERGWHAVTSPDGGATWERSLLAAERDHRSSVWASAAVDSADVFYFAWAEWNDAGSAVYLASSTDARQWSAPFALVQGPGARAMPWIAASGPGELGAVWYQRGGSPDPSVADGDWFVHAARVRGADGGAPTVEEVRASDVAVHDGEICLEGPACGQLDSDRRLLDYPGIAFGPDGRAYLVVAATKGFGLEDPVYGHAVVLVERARA